jgi:parallel beta-helix repeat protein
MKTEIKRIAASLCVALLGLGLAWAGDGQIDIAMLPYTINHSGSYIVTRDLTVATTETNGIAISADNVTLDLNGHALIGPGKTAGTSGTAIFVVGSIYNLAIRNGTVRDWRGSGVEAFSAQNSQYEGLRCYNNGLNGIGLWGTGNTVTGNTCSSNDGRGICAGSGCTVSGNSCSYNTLDGIYAWYGCTVSGNTCSYNTDDGIGAWYGCTVSANTCFSNTRDGICVYGGCMVVENTCAYNGAGAGDGAGINADLWGNAIEHNLVMENDRGIDCNPATGNYIASNRARLNTTNYDIVGGNTQGAGDLANVSF